MWAVLYLHIDGRLICEREIWLTCRKGNAAKAKREHTINEATQLLKKRYKGQLETCDNYEIVLHIESNLALWASS